MSEYFGVAEFVFVLYVLTVSGLCYLGFRESGKSYDLGVKHGRHDFSGELVNAESEGFRNGMKAGYDKLVSYVNAEFDRIVAAGIKIQVIENPAPAKTNKPVSKAPAKKVATKPATKKVIAQKPVAKPVKKVVRAK